MTEHGRHEAAEPATEPAPPRTFRAELLDAINPRTVLLGAAVLLLQLGFILSYVGAFHSPKPHRISIGVIAPSQQASALVAQLNGIAGGPVRARAVSSADSATRQLKEATLSSALIIDPTGKTDTLLVASAGGVPVAAAVEEVVKAAEARQQRGVTVRDVVPVEPGDYRGLTGFYLVIGWIVGGYLIAALLGVAKGARPANLRRAVIRLGSMVPYAILSGLGGVLVVDQGLGALTGHFVELWWLGALLVLAAATVTMAFQILLGVIGIGLTVLVFVVLGNPSAGGAYQPALLPPFWRAISGALPNGAGTDAVRRIVYFDAHGIAGHVLVIAAYAVSGLAVALTAATLRRRNTAQTTQPASPTSP